MLYLGLLCLTTCLFTSDCPLPVPASARTRRRPSYLRPAPQVSSLLRLRSVQTAAAHLYQCQVAHGLWPGLGHWHSTEDPRGKCKNGHIETGAQSVERCVSVSVQLSSESCLFTSTCWPIGWAKTRQQCFISFSARHEPDQMWPGLLLWLCSVSRRKEWRRCERVFSANHLSSFFVL